jgi:serine/threonine protein kinase
MPMSEDAARAAFAQIARGLAFLHLSVGICHGAVSPENAVIDDYGRIELTDVGIGNAPLVFTAPEVLAGEPASPAADVWAAGIVLYHMVVGRPPFRANNLPKFLAAVTAQDVPIPLGLSVDLSDLTRRMLAREASARITIAEVVRHRWVGGGRWEPRIGGSGGERLKDRAAARIMWRAKALRALEAEDQVLPRLEFRERPRRPSNQGEIPRNMSKIMRPVREGRASFRYITLTRLAAAGKGM